MPPFHFHQWNFNFTKKVLLWELYVETVIMLADGSSLAGSYLRYPTQDNLLMLNWMAW